MPDVLTFKTGNMTLVPLCRNWVVLRLSLFSLPGFLRSDQTFYSLWIKLYCFRREVSQILFSFLGAILWKMSFFSTWIAGIGVKSVEAFSIRVFNTFLHHRFFHNFSEGFFHSFFLLLNSLLHHGVNVTLSRVVGGSFTQETSHLTSWAFLSWGFLLTMRASILVFLLGVSYFSANLAGTSVTPG